MILPARSPAVLAAAAVAVVSCGAAPPAPAVRHLVPGEHDAGRTITIHRGDAVELVLFEPRGTSGSSNRWRASSSAPSVLHLTSTDRHGPSSGSYYIADFVAGQGGTARLTAVSSVACTTAGPPPPPVDSVSLRSTHHQGHPAG